MAGERVTQVSRPGVPAHPSSPIPVHGQPIGSQVRVALGDTGMRIFPVILGGAEFGWTIDLAASHAVLDAYLQRGGNALHTADGYASGRSEHIIGRWLASRGIRDDVIVTVRVGGHPDNPGLGSVNLVRSVEASLRRLATDRIDVLYLDAATDGSTALEDTLATAEWLVESGKVRALGASGYTAMQLVEARILSSAGYPRFAVLDVPYNMLHRSDFDGDLRLIAGAQGLAVTPSQALEHGYLTGAHRDRSGLASTVRGSQLAAWMNRRGARVLKALDRISDELAVPTAAISVSWLLAQRIVTAPIVNAGLPGHVDQFVQGVGAKLGRTHLADIARAVE
ncbi:aldo/keto reductase [Microbacterium oleivorans]|uniref:Aldo/keto reductase n=1 Tax=Microbacterium oleivorans TaxID=273677 RepID=A0A7D5FAH2_9MICO|nr:aldo/keto reductase [Microbacterium oleivorans]QLD12689.1 aldo/keto reductase [Microbacterium oleivorans]